MTFKDRLAEAREARDLTLKQVGEWFGVSAQAVSQWESGGRMEMDKLPVLAERLGVTVGWLLGQESGGVPEAPLAVSGAPAGAELPPKNAEIGGAVALTHRIPLYGQAEGGKDGMFVLNGNRISDILAPPDLAGVLDAYAVYVMGSSMEPRYFAGQRLFVSPRQPVRQGDDVVVQIAAEVEGDPPYAFIKQFASRGSKLLRVEQYNPRKVLEFPVSKLVSVHRIVGAWSS